MIEERYETEFFEHFKEVARNHYRENRIKDFSFIYEETKMYLEVMGDISKEYCEHWFSDVYQYRWLEKLLFSIERFEELCLINENSCYIDNNEKQIDFPWDKVSFLDSLESMCLLNGQNFNISNPFVSFSLEIFNRPYRISMIHQNELATELHRVSIRSLAKKTYSYQNFSMSEQDNKFIQSLIDNKANVIIAGATGSGKTSFTNFMLEKIPANEHLVVLQDLYELKRESPFTTQLLASSKEDLKKQLSWSLRIKPDRIILGEIRSSEIIGLILAMNTGHRGVLTTIHADNAVDTIMRLKLLFRMYADIDISEEVTTSLLCKNVDYIIHMEDKKIKSVIKIVGSENGTPFFEEIELSNYSGGNLVSMTLS